MLRKAWLINIVLLLTAGFLAWKSYGVWSNGSPRSFESATGAPQGTEAVRPPEIYQRAVPSEADYEVVAQKNLFAADRREPEKEVAQTEAEPEVKADPVTEKAAEELLKRISLYGIVIVDELKLALVQHPPASDQPMDARNLRRIRYAARGRTGSLETSWVKVDDTLNIFKVTDIQADRVVLSDGAASHEVLLYDSGKPKEREKIKPKEESPTVVEVKPGQPVQPAAADQQAAAQPVPGQPAPAQPETVRPAGKGRVAPGEPIQMPRVPPRPTSGTPFKNMPDNVRERLLRNN